MIIQIHNFRGIEKAEILVEPIALILGDNRAGKTSIARACAAALSRTVIPYDLTKKDCGMMVRRGAVKGSVTVTSETGSTTVEWKSKGDAESYTVGDAPVASLVASGIVDPTAIEPKALGSILIEAIKANVTEKDFAAALEEAGLKSSIASMWAVITKDGWDLALKQTKESGTRAKGAWETITGEKYGVNKAKEWIPATANGTIPAGDIDLLRTRVDAASAAVDAALRNVGASTSKREMLEAEAGKLEALEANLPALEKAEADAKADLEKVEAEFTATPSPFHTAKETRTAECPCCKAALQVSPVHNGYFKLTPPVKEERSEKEIEAAKDAYAKISGKFENRKTKAAEARHAAANCRTDIVRAKEAKASLEALPKGKDGAEAAYASAQENLNAARLAYSTKEVYDKAVKAASDVADKLALVEILSETGLRRKKLSEALEAFYAVYLHPICEKLELPPITISEDMAISVGETPLIMLSGSEGYRARAALQIAIARVDGSSTVILDGADIILTPSHRSGLLKAVISSGLKAIVAMAYKDPASAPNLEKSGKGYTYWISNGEANLVAQQPPIAA